MLNLIYKNHSIFRYEIVSPKKYTYCFTGIRHKDFYKLDFYIRGYGIDEMVGNNEVRFVIATLRVILNKENITKLFIQASDKKMKFYKLLLSNNNFEILLDNKNTIIARVKN